MKKVWTGNRVRLAKAKAQIEALSPRDRRQKGLKRMLLGLIPVIDEWAEPGMEAHFEIAWQALERCRATWPTPEVWGTSSSPLGWMSDARKQRWRTPDVGSAKPATASPPSGRATATSGS